MKSISLKDIAHRTGVSPTTVSFVLNGKAREKRISEQVIHLVEKVVKELNYKPNQLARGLRTGKTKTIGLMVEDISNSFFSMLAKVIEDEADRYGYEVLYCSTEDKNEKAEKLLRTFTNRQVDGYILTPTTLLENDIRQLLGDKKPLILVDRYFPDLKTNYVGVDNFKGAYKAASHILDQGYRQVAIVTTASGQTQMRQRRAGFMQALQRYNIIHKRQMELSIPFHENEENTVNQIGDFLIKRKPDAIFFTTNYLGLYGLEAIKNTGWDIPSRIGVISFDDHALFRLHEPGITCIAQPMKAIGREVVRILLDEIKAPLQIDFKQEVLEPELIIRASCGERKVGLSVE